MNLSDHGPDTVAPQERGAGGLVRDHRRLGGWVQFYWIGLQSSGQLLAPDLLAIDAGQ